MAKHEVIVKQNQFLCDQCGAMEVIEQGKKNDWLILRVTEKSGLRLFERNTETDQYESFNIPDKRVLAFCNTMCAQTYLSNSISLFLSELQGKNLSLNQNRTKLL